MQAEICFDFLPPTLNEIVEVCKDNPHKYASLKRDYTRDCAIASLGAPAFSGKVWLAFHWQVKTKRRDPADNTPAAAKFVLDGLVNAGILKDDSGFIIQPPVVHTWEQAKTEGLTLTISDRPIYELKRLCENQSIA